MRALILIEDVPDDRRVNVIVAFQPGFHVGSPAGRLTTDAMDWLAEKLNVEPPEAADVE